METVVRWNVAADGPSLPTAEAAARGRDVRVTITAAKIIFGARLVCVAAVINERRLVCFAALLLEAPATHAIMKSSNRGAIGQSELDSIKAKIAVLLLLKCQSGRLQIYRPNTIGDPPFVGPSPVEIPSRCSVAATAYRFVASISAQAVRRTVHEVSLHTLAVSFSSVLVGDLTAEVPHWKAAFIGSIGASL